MEGYGENVVLIAIGRGPPVSSLVDHNMLCGQRGRKALLQNLDRLSTMRSDASRLTRRSHQ